MTFQLWESSNGIQSFIHKFKKVGLVVIHKFKKVGLVGKFKRYSKLESPTMPKRVIMKLVYKIKRNLYIYSVMNFIFYPMWDIINRF